MRIESAASAAMVDFRYNIPAFAKLKLENYRSLATARVASAPQAVAGEIGWPQAETETDDEDRRHDVGALAWRSAGSDAERFMASWQALGGRGDGAEVLARVAAMHDEKTRHFHTLQHVREGLRMLGVWREAAERPHEIAIALWFHHAALDVHRHDNEARSARVAMQELTTGGVTPEIARRVRDLVVATRRDGLPLTEDGKLMLDIDSSILGASAERYEEYETQLRREFGHVPDFVYRRKRMQTLQSLLARPRIYGTAVAHRRLDEPARANLLRKIEELGSRAV